MDLLLTKYLKANIQYEGINRVEEYPYPEKALREALMNAVAHKDYGSGHPVQISVYQDKIIFWNEGQLPDNWTAKRLTVKHPSRPFNPDIASAFFRAGLIEAWGRGTILILSECRQAGLPVPVFEFENTDFSVTIEAQKGTTQVTTQVTAQVTAQETAQVNELVERLVMSLDNDMSRQALQQVLKIKHLVHFRNSYLRPALEAGYVEMTIPEKPNSSRQRYRLTAKGKLLRAKARINN
jgi:ATP-dependent DNA helicase RecG